MNGVNAAVKGRLPRTTWSAWCSAKVVTRHRADEPAPPLGVPRLGRGQPVRGAPRAHCPSWPAPGMGSVA